ncbi:MAG: phosphopyruvate hydratase [Candidatus Bilamarchaeaceae archaeon]
MKIIGVFGREILDSRGNPTVEVDVIAQGGVGSAAAPSGASTGKHEAVELRDGGKRYGGKGVLKAVENVNTIIGPALEGMDVTKQEEIDLKMRELDGTKDKSRLGANAIVATSMAVLRAAAAVNNQPLYKYIGGSKLPIAMFNVINGGKHAGGKLAIQEFLIIPKGKTFSERLQAASEIYHTLGKYLEKKYGPSARNVGDEGGYAPQMNKTDDALDALSYAVEEAGYEKECSLAIDAAASSFYDSEKDKYILDEVAMDSKELLEFYKELVRVYKVESIEDPFHEEAYEDFAALTKAVGKNVQIVGDDLLVTNIERIKEAIAQKAVTALLLKINQIGTVSEALEAANLCKENGLNIIVSHRSGETEDNFIADFAVGINAGQIKTGAPARGERTAKYNQLLRIEESIRVEAE